jgi:DNA-binding transcriptional MerR regulator
MSTLNLSIKQFSQLTGLSSYTLRYYEKIGLMLNVARDAKGHRFYTQNDIEWLDFLHKMKNTGMSLKDMQSFAKLRKGGDDTLTDRLEILQRHYKKIAAERDELNIVFDNLKQKIKYYQNLQKEKNKA